MRSAERSEFLIELEVRSTESIEARSTESLSDDAPKAWVGAREYRSGFLNKYFHIYLFRGYVTKTMARTPRCVSPTSLRFSD